MIYALLATAFLFQQDSEPGVEQVNQIRKRIEAAGGQLSANRDGTIDRITFIPADGVDDNLMQDIASFTELKALYLGSRAKSLMMV